MKYAVEMGSGAMIYIPRFVKTGIGIQKLIEGDTPTASISHKPAFIFFQNKERGLKIGPNTLQILSKIRLTGHSLIWITATPTDIRI
jgi:hypothetical protein